jgi:hypothetical protein
MRECGKYSRATQATVNNKRERIKDAICMLDNQGKYTDTPPYLTL